MAIDSSMEKQPEVFIPEEWEEAADTLAYDSITSPPPICVICGPPNSGKTTFSRHLLNVLIHRYRRVAYLDTDVGQAEFTPPGCLSLTLVDKLTPDLAIPCLKTPERCFFFGDITPKKDPRSYLKYIHELYDHYHQTIMGENLKIGVPLVVNTPGWVEGYGLNLLMDILRHITPTQVVKVHVPNGSNNLPVGAFWLPNDQTCHNITMIDINSNRPMKKTVHSQDDSRLLRDIRLLAYFRKCLPIDMSLTTIQELDHALAVHPHYEILMSSVKIKQLHYQDAEAFYKSKTCCIVGLVDSTLSRQKSPSCVGLGIVTGVDMSRKVLYLITPVPENILENVDILLYGLIKIPACLLEVQQGHKASSTVPTN